MNFYKLPLISVCFIPAFLLHISFAQTPPNASNGTGSGADPKAKAILDEMSARTKTFHSMTIEFEYNIENKKDNIHEHETGKLLLKGQKYRIEIPGQEIICDEKTVWTYLKDVNEVQINVPQTDDQSINPTSIFSIYEKGFKFQFVKEEEKNGKTCQIINLFPVNPAQKPYHTVRLTIDKSKKQIQMLEVLGKDGGITTYSIKKMDTDTPLDDSKFTFDKTKFPGVEVIDLR